ncbi:cell division protein SepF [Priestia sp. SB1]|uniref:Cell division protein SepF n=1 Tax=Priestia aryabhattai TaxID=412384 RepID=A0AAX6ND74_PRIAR|nr:cell division protein SepF [Priestia aryabhattai]MDU9693686.1 cell division protein SepF [Priestia aryabhattai]NGY89079.1 cell division protein SepF [Priestia megaterium]
MAQIGKELKKTISQFSSAFKNEDQPAQEEKDKAKTATATATPEVNEETVEKYRRTLNKVENDYSGRIISSVSQKNKPRRAVYINESKAVRAMEMKEKDDSYLVIDEIRDGQPVLVLFDSVEPAVQKSILDTIYGACHLGNIAIEKIGAQMILIDPNLKK